MPPVSVMFKPSSSACNFACKYCFYHDEVELRKVKNYGFISKETFKKAIEKIYSYANGNPVYISFQGGEPLLSGKEFFEFAFQTIHSINYKNSPVYIAVQTNGSLIDEDFCKLFKTFNVLVGVSLDGAMEENVFRVDNKGFSTFNRVYSSIELLKKYNVEFNCLSVVTKKVADNINEVFKFFDEAGVRNIQFIPCLKPFEDLNSNSDMYMDSVDYGKFLTEGAKEYAERYFDGKYISVRNFDNFVNIINGRLAEQCGGNGHCCFQYVIEGNGNIYPCDFYCLDEWLLGNVATDDFDSIAKGEKQRKFIEASLVIPNRCKACKLFKLCKGGCKRERYDENKCKAFEFFFENGIKYLLAVAKAENNFKD